MHPLAEPLRAYALGLPEAYEDHPWGENVAKVGKKVFAFFGQPDAERPFGLTVKLPESSDAALDMLMDGIAESYRAVAPKRLVQALERQP